MTATGLLLALTTCCLADTVTVTPTETDELLASPGMGWQTFNRFADDDPKTAEVLAKTLLLARDEEIKDPRILRQIRH